jgi:hypothetical protein
VDPCKKEKRTTRSTDIDIGILLTGSKIDLHRATGNIPEIRSEPGTVGTANALSK